MDAARPSFGDLPVLSSLTETLGRGMWKETMVVLTHANAAREAQGRDYFQLSKQRRSVLESLVGGGWVWWGYGCRCGCGCWCGSACVCWGEGTLCWRLCWVGLAAR
jgi:hypothetical protein